MVRAKFRVKIKSLATEAKIIQREKQRRREHGYVYYEDFVQRVADSLESHARNVVATEARHTLLAYAFFRGKPYKDVERSCRIPPDKRAIARILKSLVSWKDQTDAVDKWLSKPLAEAA